MRRNYGPLLLFSMCLTIVFIVLNMKSSTVLLESASVAGKQNPLMGQEESRADYRLIAHNKVKVNKKFKRQ